MRQFLNHVYRLCDGLAAFSILVLAVIVVAQILARLAGLTVPGAHEAAAFLMAISIYLSLAYTLVMGGHIRVTLILDRLSPRARWWAEIWSHLFSVYIMGYLAAFSIMLAWASWQGGEMSEGLAAIPIYIPQVAMAFGLCLLVVRLVDQLILLFQTGAIPRESDSKDATADLPGGFT